MKNITAALLALAAASVLRADDQPAAGSYSLTVGSVDVNIVTIREEVDLAEARPRRKTLYVKVGAHFGGRFTLKGIVPAKGKEPMRIEVEDSVTRRMYLLRKGQRTVIAPAKGSNKALYRRLTLGDVRKLVRFVASR